jgi:hypothetical protein
MGPTPLTAVLRRRGDFGHRHPEKGMHVKMGTELGVMLVQANEYQQFLTYTRN